MHGIVAAKLDDTEAALDYFRETSAIDLSDSHAALAGGVHMAGLAGIWSMVVLGFAGLSLRSDCLCLDPRLPAAWESLAFRLQWRCRHIRISIARGTGTLEAGEPTKRTVRGKEFQLDRAKTLHVARASEAYEPQGIQQNGLWRRNL